MAHEHHHHDHHHSESECCEHEYHHHEECEEESLKSKLFLIGTTILLLVAAVFIEKNWELKTWQLLLIYLVPYLLTGHETLKEAGKSLLHGDIFNEDFLMSIATIGALCIVFLPGAETEFPEAVFVMLFFQIGEMFEEYAEGKSRDSISHLMDIRPDVASVEREGVLMDVGPSSVKIGEIIVVKPGDKVPLDGVVVEGVSSLNTVALTGESVPREVNIEDEVASGCVNLTGVLRIRTTKMFSESTVSKIIELVEHATEHKSKSETFIAKFAKIYTPIVVISALLLAFLPPFFVGDSYALEFPVWLHRALIFLVVSCPCALVISVPLTFFGGIGGASKNGILVKGANFMDTLSKVKTVVFDKTGTLTQGEFAVEAVHPDKCDEQHLLHLAAHVEHFSNHPIAVALRNAYPDEENDGCELKDVEEIAGQGMKAVVNGSVVCVGNSKMMESIGAQWRQCDKIGTIVHVTIDGEYAGHIVINDKVKEDSREAIAQLKSLGVKKTVMLTGDRKEVGENVAQELGLDDYYTELLPTDKVSHVEQLLHQSSEENKLAFVGDGINDAPVLARADVGIAMGAMGSDAAIEAADVVLMDDQPSKVAKAISIARRTIRIAQENVIFAIGVKVLVLVLAVMGVATMWMAVFADVGVTVLAVLNAMRALK